MARHRPPETPDEWEAKWVVAEALGAIPERRVGPGHDYDLRFQGRVAALEVTRSTPQERNALNAAISRGNARECPHVTTHWQLTIPDAGPDYRGPSLKAIYAEAPSRLGVLERHGIWGFGRGHEWQHKVAPELARLAVLELLALKIIAGHSVGPLMPKERPLLLVGTSGHAGVVDGDELNRSIETAALRKAGQLLAATANERHLFVIIESTDYAAHAAISAGLRLPDRVPTLPRGIDTVWAGAWAPRSTYGCDLSPILRVTPPHPWARIQVGNPHGYGARLGEGQLAAEREQQGEIVRRVLTEANQRVRAVMFGHLAQDA